MFVIFMVLRDIFIYSWVEFFVMKCPRFSQVWYIKCSVEPATVILLAMPYSTVSCGTSQMARRRWNPWVLCPRG